MRDFLERNEIPTRECVVIESDWPIYEEVWAMVQRMAEAEANLCQDEGCPQHGTDHVCNQPPCRFHDNDQEACETYSGDVPCEPDPRWLSMRKSLAEGATLLANINTYCHQAKVGVWGDSASQALIDDHRWQAERLQRIETIVKEWERGCSNTEGHHPAHCVECTSGALDAIKTQLNS